MQIEVTPKSKSLQGITDLTLVAPIKPGMIDALDTRTYASRLRLLLKTLTAVRASSREYSATQFFSDTVERIAAIHSFRLVILEDQQKLLLAVTFDSAWEPYIRVIWRDLGPLLDVIFCNCDRYVMACGSSYEAYAAWIREAQLQTEFFYSDSELTIPDVQYLRQSERLSRELPASDVEAARLVAKQRETLAMDNIRGDGREAAKQGLAALTGLYRLVDMYPPDTDDGDVLLRAGHELLKELRKLDTKQLFPANSPARRSLGPQLAWFESEPKAISIPVAPKPAPKGSDVQGGILTSYEATHGAMLLYSLEDAASGLAFVEDLLQQNAITTEDARPPAGSIALNVAFTAEGLRKLGLTEVELGGFPQEFREGMENRAGVLGDLRSNHPRNWALPERNRLTGGSDANERIQMSMVDLVVQLQVHAQSAAGDHQIVGNTGHPLYAKAAELSDLPGVHLLSVQAMRRNIAVGESIPRDHFGFLDGISQPEVGDEHTPGTWSNKVPWGEVFLGHPNASGDAASSNELLIDGTFLVVRKLRQDVAALDVVLEVASGAVGLSPDDLKAKMMGRTVDGDPLVAPGQSQGNAFDYKSDEDGGLCPFQAHIRRSNPRTSGTPEVPRIVRRGMSYGPRYDAASTAQDERGVMFMAYNASIAEQFEVIQRWISGGNSTGVLSGHSDPLLGVPQRGDPRTFRFQHNGSVERIELDPQDPQDPKDGRPFVQLEWGAYLFVPSVPALEKLCTIPAKAAPMPWSVADGEETIQALLANQGKAGSADDWKALLEDISSRMTHKAASVWAAVRELHGGVLRTPYGVLVASKELTDRVFADADQNYSVRGYADRMHRSFGLIYLGLDAGTAYTAQSSAINAALMEVSQQDAFLLARGHTQLLLRGLIDATKQQAAAANDTRWSLVVDMKDLSDGVLARLCVEWFGVPDGVHVEAGGWQWNWKQPSPPRCPGHFHAPSRYMFQPNPGTKAAQYGEVHGQALKEAFRSLVADRRANGLDGLPVLGRAIFDAFPNPQDDDLLASTFIGVLMGFLPTVDGNLRGCLYEWINDRRLWDLQETFLADAEPDIYQRARKVLADPLRHTMQLRPVPEIVWRTAAKAHRIGNVAVAVGDTVVNSIVSATQELLSTGSTSVDPIFGSDRSAATTHTHACPAYPMGMGVLLGIVTGLMEMGPMRPTPAPLTLNWSGKL